MGPGSRLQRGTPFLCDVRFTASLPEVPCDPKLVVEPPSDARDLARFSLTSLERGPLRDVALGEDAAGAAAVVVSSTGEKGIVGSLAGGLCVSLLTPENYEFEKASMSNQALLSAEDATLLVNAERALASARAAEAKALAAAAAASSAAAPAGAAASATAAAPIAVVGGPPVPITRKPQGKELAWLMRTSYVTAAGGVRAGTGRGAGGGGALGGAATVMEEDELAPAAGATGEEGGAAAAAAAAALAAPAAPVLDREGLLREIDATFAAARELDASPPLHPTKPGELVAVSVRPVLPHARLSGNHHVLVTLDRDPLADFVPAAAFAKAAAKGKSNGSVGDAKPPRLTAEEEGFLLSRAVAKSYRAPRDPSKKKPDAAAPDPGEIERFLAYMVPSEIPEGLLLGGANDGGDEERRAGGVASTSSPSSSDLRTLPFSGEYEWVREFGYELVKEAEEQAKVAARAKGGAGAAAALAARFKKNYLLDLSSSPSAAKKRRRDGLDAEPVRLVPLDTRLATTSKKLSFEVPITRPSRTTVRARERTAAEAEAARARRGGVFVGE